MRSASSSGTPSAACVISMACWVAAMTLLVFSRPACAQVAHEGVWVANGAVDALAQSNGVLYMGGAFTEVAPQCGSWVALDAATGVGIAPYPLVDGGVLASAPDGSGGWFIGGAFHHVGGMPRNNLAHIDAAGNVTPWDPNVTGPVNQDGTILTIAKSGSTVYVGGSFAYVGGQIRSDIAAIDSATGVARSWNPSISSGSTINTIVPTSSGIWVGGYYFGTNLTAAAFDSVTAVITHYAVIEDGIVDAIVVKGDTLYAGGSFSHAGLGSPAHHYIARLSISSENAETWDPHLDGNVEHLVFNRGVLYATGSFTHVNGLNSPNLGAINYAATSTGWLPHPNGYVGSVAVSGNLVYVGGAFTNIGGEDRAGLAALDITTATATSWDPNLLGYYNPEVLTIGVGGGHVFAGGYFRGVNAEVRNHLAALDQSTGAALGWDPNADAEVRALAVSGSTVYAGGDFAVVGGQPRGHLCALDAVTGSLTPWDPSLDGAVLAIATSHDTVYAGGNFGLAFGSPHHFIVAIDGTTGLPNPWDPNSDGAVHCLLPRGANLYVGGQFQNIGGQPRSGIAALDPQSNTASAWDPSVSGEVDALLAAGNVIYAGGGFNYIGGQPRQYLAGIDAGSGTVTPMSPQLDGPVASLGMSAGALYAAGNFSNAGSLVRRGVAAIDTTVGNALSWDDSLNSEGRALMVVDTTLYVGGDFGSALHRSFSGLAAGSTYVPTQLALTLANQGRGLLLTDYAVGFPAMTPGPAGIAFEPNHKVLVSHFGNSNIYEFPNHTDNQLVSLPVHHYSSTQVLGIAQLQVGSVWHYYISLGGSVVEYSPVLNDTIQTIVGGNFAAQLTPFPPSVTSPLHGHIFASGGLGIWDVDPIAKTKTLFAGTNPAEGLVFAPTGDTVYVALPGEDVVRAFSVPGGSILWSSASHGEPYLGLAVGLGNLAGYIYASTSAGTIWEIGNPHGPHAFLDDRLATGGSVGRAMAVDPDVYSGTFPSLLIMQGDRVSRLDPPGGGWFGGPTSSTIPVSTGSTAGVRGAEGLGLWLAPPQPNPGRGRSLLSYSIPLASSVDLSIFDVGGRRLRVLAKGLMPAGIHRVTWDGRDEGGRSVPSGLYFVRLLTANQHVTRTLVMLR